MECETRAGKKYKSVGDGLSWVGKNMGFEKLSKFDSLHIECYVDILFIEYKKKLKMPPWIALPVARIKDTRFVWNIEEELLSKFKQENNKWGYYSDTFMEHCLSLICRPNDYGTMKLKVRLLRIPYGVKGYIVNAKFTVYLDNKEIVKENKNHFMDLNELCCVSICDAKELKKVNVLSAVVDIKVLNVREDVK